MDNPAGTGRIVKERTEGASYDYQAQVWREYHDHTHLVTVHPDSRIEHAVYCGADLVTCEGAR